MGSERKYVSVASRGRLLAGVGLLVLATAALGGCQTTSLVDPVITSSTRPPSLKTTAEAARKWEADPGNAKHGLHYVGMLNSIGQNEKALTVLAELVKRNPDNDNLAAIYGKELAEAGRSQKAVEVLLGLVHKGKADWKVQSAMGSAYDQQGQFSEARKAYQSALAMKPGEVLVLNNLAMSYALEGNLAEAERILRQASNQAAGKSDVRLRQNLALVVGLQGRFDEAKQIASKDLPPVQVEANMTFLRTMLAQPDSWQQLKQPSATTKG
jgi:Flp pilus assembly protein TadD